MNAKSARMKRRSSTAPLDTLALSAKSVQTFSMHEKTTDSVMDKITDIQRLLHEKHEIGHKELEQILATLSDMCFEDSRVGMVLIRNGVVRKNKVHAKKFRERFNY